MRVKKQKRTRKSVKFYSACFGFREPFKILCDGTFIHHLFLHHLSHSHITSLLSAPVKLFTSRCIVAELKSMGDSYTASFHSARQLLTARCDHEQRKSSVGCIADIIGKNNSEHFFVATQDSDLRKKLQEIPGVPLIYGLRNSLFIESPSEHQRKYAKSAEEDRLHMNQSEFMTLKKKVEMKTRADSPDAHEGLGDDIVTAQALTKTKKTKKPLGVVDKVQFKRKKAKGPNPLSCKKKKNKSSAPVAQNQDGDDSRVHRKSRKRKRRGSKIREFN